MRKAARQARLLVSAELPRALAEQIHSLELRTNWGPYSDPRQVVWDLETARVAVVLVGERLACHVGILHREVRIAGRPQFIGGISSVMTEPEFQGRGYATAALDVATAFILSQLDVPFALLTALRHRQSLYAGRGWQTIPNPVFCEQPTGKIPLNMPGRYLMALPVRSATLPTGDIDLCGLPW